VGQALLRIRGLTKAYVPGRPVLHGIDLDIGAEGITAIIGPSGTGKSTLLRCINRLVEPSAGSIEMGGVDVARLRGRALRAARRRIGMVFQEYNLVERLSVMENVLCGRLGYVPFWRAWLRRYPSTDIERAFALLDAVGLPEQATSRADALSGGQRQRVGIARALMQSPGPAAGRRADLLARPAHLGRGDGADGPPHRRGRRAGHRQHPQRGIGAALRPPHHRHERRRGGVRRPARRAGAFAPPAHLWRRGGVTRPDPFPPNWPARLLALLLLAYAIYAASLLGITAERLAIGLGEAGRFLARMVPPNFARWELLLEGMLESLQIAVLASVLGILLSLPLGLMAARNLSPAWSRCPRAASWRCAARCTT
jgi:phosphonate transport system ATP-binding protein